MPNKIKREKSEEGQIKQQVGRWLLFNTYRNINDTNTLKLPPSSQVGHEQTYLVSQSGELTAKFKHMACTGVFGGRIDSGEIKNFHGFPKKSFEKDKRPYGTKPHPPNLFNDLKMMLRATS
jgi:hypothetical protein